MLYVILYVICIVCYMLYVICYIWEKYILYIPRYQSKYLASASDKFYSAIIIEFGRPAVLPIPDLLTDIMELKMPISLL